MGKGVTQARGVTSLEGGSKGARQDWKEGGAALQSVEEKGCHGGLETDRITQDLLRAMKTHLEVSGGVDKGPDMSRSAF